MHKTNGSRQVNCTRKQKTQVPVKVTSPSYGRCSDVL